MVAGDGTQTRRSSRKMEGAHWLHIPPSPVFKRGIHMAQCWFNGKSRPQSKVSGKEWEAAVAFLVWLKQQ